ncbi:hypothetical protein FZEAL_9303 [Fusarium zealandicum]|uniref:Uncharacterized protein n=1 Tax=Fusarium zealandicum TaxID=1053134 RepID=A0A8H4XGF3_9HYPO|nr:hypothetical protein FZEAL_9303 [Fusarium zealandicum]
MLTKGSLSDTTSITLGQRRGISDLARISLDLTWAPERAEQDTFARSRAYPSPPMSGSPPLPPKLPQDAGDRGQVAVGYSNSSRHDAYRGTLTQQPSIDHQRSINMQPSLPRLFQQEVPEASPYSYRRPEEPVPRPASYIQTGASSMPQQPGYAPPGGPGVPGVPGVPAPYPASARPTTAENQPMTSPKSQRKTKGHVASACVPCKRAHLRFPHPQDAVARRPLSIYPSGVPMGPGEHIPPRYLERMSSTDAGAYGAPLSASSRSSEPVAFLNMKLDFAKASPAFAEAVGRSGLEGQNLGDLVVPAEKEIVLSIRTQLIEEQTKKEPNHLPPILARLDHVIQGLGFSTEEVGRFQLEGQEYLTFIGFDGQPRHYPVRLGLAKEGSIYFVVLVLNLSLRQSYPLPPSPVSRGVAQGYTPQPPTPQSAYSSRVSVQPPFDPARSRFSEGPLVSRPAPGPSIQLPVNATTGIAVGPRGPSYSASPGRTEYTGPASYHIPRSELSAAAARPRPQASFQLPPIRAQPGQPEPPPSGEQAWTREERPNRVDIGGLIEKPDAPRQPR